MSAAASARRAFTLRDPEKFLRFLQSQESAVDLSGVSLTEMWSLAAIAALARQQKKQPLKVIGWEPNALQFAQAVGFDDLVAGSGVQVRGEPGRTVRLNEVWDEQGVEPVSRDVAEMLASVLLDFLNVRLCTQSFAHALLFDALRVSWATRTPIFVVNVQPVVRSALRHVESYAQSG